MATDSSPVRCGTGVRRFGCRLRWCRFGLNHRVPHRRIRLRSNCRGGSARRRARWRCHETSLAIWPHGRRPRVAAGGEGISRDLRPTGKRPCVRKSRRLLPVAARCRWGGGIRHAHSLYSDLYGNVRLKLNQGVTDAARITPSDSFLCLRGPWFHSTFLSEALNLRL